MDWSEQVSYIMKKWKKYEPYLLTGDWHVHTMYTDGKNTVFENCIQAEKNGLDLIAFTEHVWRKLDYNFNDFVSDVFSAKDRFDLEVLVGCEAKVIDIYGNLDVSKNVLNECEIALGAFHGFKPPLLKEEYLIALKNMICNPSVDIWAHPTLYAKNNDIYLNKCDLGKIANMCSNHDVLIEINMKHYVPNNIFQEIASISNCKFVIGSDSHQITDLLKNNSIGGI